MALAAAMLLGALALAGAPTSEAGTSIGRANLDGTNVDRDFISAPAPTCGPNDLAVDGAHIYWIRCISDGDKYFPQTWWYIARANLDGSGVEQSFIDLNHGSACDLAVGNAHIYWTTCGGMVGRANLDGSGADPSFIKAAGQETKGVAVDSAHIYWGYVGTDEKWYIARANLDGSGVENSFITGVDLWLHLAIDAKHIYWGNGRVLDPSSHSIGRADLDGSAVNRTFVPNASAQCGLAVNADHMFWLDPGLYNPPESTAWIARANLDGTSVSALIHTPYGVCGGLAVDGAHIYWVDWTVSPDTTDPVARKLRLEPARFAALTSGDSIVSKSKRRARKGSSVSYQLSEAAYTSFAVERRITGRRKRGVCLTKRERSKRCTTYEKLKGGFGHQGQSGANSFRFSGRLEGRKLSPGSYRLVATPTDGAGNKGGTIREKFRIVRR